MEQQTRIERAGIWVIALAFVIAAGLVAAALATGAQPAPVEKARIGIGTDYVETLFDTSRVHVINLEISKLNWDYMITHATEEQYVLCDAVIDGERIENVALRPKGNSSLTAIQQQGSEHFSFKIEFDHYRPGNTFHGLDKLSLNNLGNDPTCMKDYFSYRLMQECGAPGYLAAYTLVQVNGEDFGLYLAVECVEESFCLRNYGEIAGQIYKPELYAVDAVFSLSKGSAFSNTETQSPSFMSGTADYLPGQRVESLAEMLTETISSDAVSLAVVSIRHVGDDPKQYQLIFNSAVFDLTPEQKTSFIRAVRTLNGERPLEALDLPAVVSYFAAQNFVDNYDGYTGGAVHNYYIREKDGRLSMIPWDYNLAFGAFTIEGALESMLGDTEYAFKLDLGDALTAEESAVNYPIDTPVQAGENRDRPMFGAWISDPAAHAAYYEVYRHLIADYFDSGRFEREYQQVYGLIRPYVERGLSFWTPERFDRGTENLRRFCLLRCESIRGQIDGTIPATKEGQMERPETLIPTGDLNLGQTVSFDGLVMGITAGDVTGILDAVCGEEERSLETVAAMVGALAEDASALPGLLLRAFQSSPLLQRMVADLALPILVTILCLLAMIIAVRRAKKPRRR